MLTSGLAFALSGGVYHAQWKEQRESLTPNFKQSFLLPQISVGTASAPIPIDLADSPPQGLG